MTAIDYAALIREGRRQLDEMSPEEIEETFERWYPDPEVRGRLRAMIEAGPPERGATVDFHTTDSEALDQIAAALGLHNTDPANNPVEGVLADIDGYVQATGRSTEVPEGA